MSSLPAQPINGSMNGGDCRSNRSFHFHDALAVLTPAQNPLTRRRKLRVSELVNEPWVQLPADTLFGSMVAEAFRPHGHEPPRPTVVPRSEYLKDDFLAKGRFLTVLPGFMLRSGDGIRD